MQLDTEVPARPERVDHHRSLGDWKGEDLLVSRGDEERRLAIARGDLQIAQDVVRSVRVEDPRMLVIDPFGQRLKRHIGGWSCANAEPEPIERKAILALHVVFGVLSK